MSKAVENDVKAFPVKMMEIYWLEGTERLEFDIDNLSDSTEIRRTVQHVNDESTNYYYRTTSTVKRLGEQLFEIAISYEHARNQSIEVADSWWGVTRIVLKQGDCDGQVTWHDAHDPQNNCTRPFKIVEDTQRDARFVADEISADQQVSRVPLHKMRKSIPRFIVGQQYRRGPDIHDKFGGSRQSGIAPSALANAIFIFTGDSGEQHGYRDHEEEDENGCRVFHYSGEGQVGHMTLNRGNLAITRHSVEGKALHLFRSLGKSKPVQYLGEYIYLDHYEIIGKDRKGQDRTVIVFKLFRESDWTTLNDAVQKDEGSLATMDLGAARALALAAASGQNERGTTKGSRTLYVRSRAVRDYVLLRANGKCELCLLPAPFLRTDGTPYLEPHHTTRVSDGGPDHPMHVGAICPSCHREIHFGQNGAERNAELQVRLREIEMNHASAYEVELWKSKETLA